MSMTKVKEQDRHIVLRDVASEALNASDLNGDVQVRCFIITACHIQVLALAARAQAFLQAWLLTSAGCEGPCLTMFCVIGIAVELRGPKRRTLGRKTSGRGILEVLLPFLTIGTCFHSSQPARLLVRL